MYLVICVCMALSAILGFCIASWLQSSQQPPVVALRHWWGAQVYRRALQDWSALADALFNHGATQPGTSVGFVGLAVIHALWGRRLQPERLQG